MPTTRYDAKYGVRNWQGGGRASARETIGRVAAAAVAKKVLAALVPGLECIGYVKTVQNLVAEVDPATVAFEAVEGNIVRTGDPAMVGPMVELIKAARGDGNSLGGGGGVCGAGCAGGVGGTGVRQTGRGVGESDDELAGDEGFRGGEWVRWDDDDGVAAQRRVLHGWR